MTMEELYRKLYQIGSTEATFVADGLETCWLDDGDDEKAKAKAIEFCRNLQGWAKKAEEVITGVRKDL